MDSHMPGQVGAEIVPEEDRTVLTEMVDDRQYIRTGLIKGIILAGQRSRAAPITAHIQGNRAISRCSQGRQLVAPAVPETGVAMTHHHQGPFSLACQVQLDAIRLELQVIESSFSRDG
jgi:hypothetical protein